MTQNSLPGMDAILGPMARPDTRPSLMPDAPPNAASGTDGGTATVRDMAGNVFDPRIHGVKPDGSPSLTSKGIFRKKRAVAGSSGRLDLSPAEGLSGRDVTGPEAAGATCAGLYIMLGGIILGEDFSPESADEFSQLADAFADYCRAKEIDDFPPGIALAMACGMYAAKRLPKPRVQSRISAAIGWIRGRFGRARVNSGTNGVRKNDASEAPSGWRAWLRGPGTDPRPVPA